MRDWRAWVNAQLAERGVEAAQMSEVPAELADHLEDVYAQAIRAGCSDADAMAAVVAEVPDWERLTDEIRRSREGGLVMSHAMKTVAVPGLGTIAATVASVVVHLQFVTAEVWADPRPQVHIAGAAEAIVVCVALGALGAMWSRYAGGDRRARLLAGLSPLALMLAVVVPALAIDMVRDLTSPSGRVGLQGLKFAMILLGPASALTLGTLPFLRERRR